MADNPKLAAQLAPAKPEGWDPRQRPVRHCPIHKRAVVVTETCPVFCGIQYTEECKFADRDPRPDEMQVASAVIAPTQEDVKWVERWRKEHRR
jgi:hypothetical protein